MQDASGKGKMIFTLLLPAFVLYTFFVVVSVVWVCFYSFLDQNSMGSMTFTGLKNYMDLLTGGPVFWLSVKNTLTYTVVEVVIQVFGGLLFATFLARITHFRVGLRTLYYVPMVISSVVIYQMFNRLFSVIPTGVINAVLGIVNPDLLYMEWIPDRKLTLCMAAFVETYKYLGLHMVTSCAALIGVPGELSEAAIMDGANVVREFIYVKIPYIMLMIVANCPLTLNGSLRSFDVPFLLTKGGSSNASELMSIYMYKQASTNQHYEHGSTVVMTTVILYLVIDPEFRRMTAKRK